MSQTREIVIISFDCRLLCIAGIELDSSKSHRICTMWLVLYNKGERIAHDMYFGQCGIIKGVWAKEGVNCLA